MALNESNGDGRLEGLMAAYSLVHNPLVILICALGACCHILIIFVLTRKSIFNPTTLMLTSLSCCQLGLLVSFFYSTIYKLLSDRKCIRPLWSWGWTLSLFIDVNLCIIFHTAAVFHVVSISVVRCVTLQFYARQNRQSWFTVARSARICIGIFVFVLLLCIPFYLNSEIVPDWLESRAHCFSDTEKNLTMDVFTIRYSNLSKRSGLLLYNFWQFGIVCKLVPCFLVLVMSVLLAYKLLGFQQSALALRRSFTAQRMTNYCRTTYLIIAVMILFVSVELPQGVINVMSAGSQKDFVGKVYDPLGDLFEMLTVLYSSVNFAIFCLMSEQFRTMIKQSIKWDQRCRFCLLCTGFKSSGQQPTVVTSLQTNQSKCNELGEDGCPSNTFNKVGNGDRQKSLVVHQPQRLTGKCRSVLV